MALTLKAGDRIAHYRVVGSLGAGGMGEVYRAKDELLDREVALKVLPPPLVADSTRLKRFVAEAKAASSLSHPNIVCVYEIGEGVVNTSRADRPPYAPESESLPLHFISMELVDGATLAAKIHAQKTPLKTLLEWLSQAADGMSKAHAAGIVHRDLNPGNIMVSKDGLTKVLDFGIATLTQRDDGGAADSTDDAKTIERLTSGDRILGTVGYMAPEQVRGQAVDRRADIFSFGCMLYEAATRRSPFAASSTVESLHRILHDEPAPPQELNPNTPDELQRLIRRCLAKERDQRPDSMRTLALEVREIVADCDRKTVAAGIPGPKKQMAMPLVLTIALLGAALSVMGIVAVLAMKMANPLRINPAMRMRAIDVPLSEIGYPGLSQDGRWIALPARDNGGTWGLYYMNVKGGDPRAIAVDPKVDVNYADISPDGSQIVYSVAKGTKGAVRTVPALGGASLTISPDGDDPRWSPDGTKIGYIVQPWQTHSHRLEFWTVRPDGSGRSRVFVDSTSEEGPPASFAWSRDAKQIAWLRNFEHGKYNEIFIRDLVTGRERQLTRDGKFIDEVTWTPRNEILFSSNRGGSTNLWMMHATGGPPRQITRGVGPDEGTRVSADGRTLLYVVKRTLARVGWWNIDTGENGHLTDGDQPIGTLVPSPDGKQVAVRALDPDWLSEDAALVIMNRDGSGRRTLVGADQQPLSFDWSPDGSRMVWATHGAKDTVQMHVIDVTTGETLSAIRLSTRGGFSNWVGWISDDTLEFVERRGTAEYSLSQGRIVSRSADLEFNYPNRVPGWTVFLRRMDSAGPPGIYARPIGGGAERLVMPSAWRCANPSTNNFLYCRPESLGFRLLELPSGRLREARHGPPEAKGFVFPPTAGGPVLYWRTEREVSRLVLVDNFQ